MSIIKKTEVVRTKYLKTPEYSTTVNDITVTYYFLGIKVYIYTKHYVSPKENPQEDIIISS